MMNGEVYTYPVVLLVFLVVVLILGKLLRTRCSIVSLLTATIIYVVLGGVIALWAARLDLQWLSPQHVFSSVSTLLVPASIIFVELLWLISGVTLWKAALIAVVSHIALVVASDFAILGF